MCSKRVDGASDRPRLLRGWEPVGKEKKKSPADVIYYAERVHRALVEFSSSCRYSGSRIMHRGHKELFRGTLLPDCVYS